MGEKTVIAAPAATPALALPSWVRYQVLAAGCSVAVITYVHRVGFARALPDIRASLHLGEQGLGLQLVADPIEREHRAAGAAAVRSHSPAIARSRPADTAMWATPSSLAPGACSRSVAVIMDGSWLLGR